MTDDLEKLMTRALRQWNAREISLHFHGRKKIGVVWIARAYLDRSAAQARLMESGIKGSVTMEWLNEITAQPIAQGQGKTAIEAVTSMAERKWAKL